MRWRKVIEQMLLFTCFALVMQELGRIGQLADIRFEPRAGRVYGYWTARPISNNGDVPWENVN